MPASDEKAIIHARKTILPFTFFPFVLIWFFLNRSFSPVHCSSSLAPGRRRRRCWGWRTPCTCRTRVRRCPGPNAGLTIKSWREGSAIYPYARENEESERARVFFPRWKKAKNKNKWMTGESTRAFSIFLSNSRVQSVHGSKSSGFARGDNCVLCPAAVRLLLRKRIQVYLTLWAKEQKSSRDMGEGEKKNFFWKLFPWMDALCIRACMLGKAINGEKKRGWHQLTDK